MMSLPVATGSTSVSYTEAYQQMLVLSILDIKKNVGIKVFVNL